MLKAQSKVQDRVQDLKDYSKPSLMEYGRVAEITKGTGVTQPDFPAGNQF